MNSTLILNLDSDVLAGAEQEARRRRTTITDVVTCQLQIMALNWRESQAGKTPLTDALRGAVSLPAKFAEEQVLTEELIRKHSPGY